MEYALIADEQVLQVGLPRNAMLGDGRMVSGFNRLPTDVLMQEGWYPVQNEDMPEFDAETERVVVDGYDIDMPNSVVIRRYRVEPLPEPDPPPPPTEQEVLGDALAYATRRIVAREISEAGEEIDADTMSSLAPLFPELSLEGMKVKKGEVYRWNHMVIEIVQTHTTQTDWLPEQSPSLYKLYLQQPEEGEDYAEWVQPTGAHDAYPAFFPGTQEPMRVTHNGSTWENTHGDGNSWEPGVFGWTEVVEGESAPIEEPTPDPEPEPEPDPEPEIAKWTQPTGAHDAYAAGATVKHKGDTWQNTHGNGNSWEPGVYGWSKVT